MHQSPPLQRPLVLGSTSRYRRELLERLGLPFTVAAPHTDETPQPGETPRADNDAAQARLEARVQALGLSLHPALGCDNRGGMVEYGCLVLDATLAQADALAREFGQGGTLCWSTGEPVRLRMMWPRPSEAGDDPYTDWVG